MERLLIRRSEESYVGEEKFKYTKLSLERKDSDNYKNNHNAFILDSVFT